MDSRLLWGTVEMLVLEILSRGPSYGYQITQAVLGQSNGYFQLTEGCLYPALHRMERQKWLTSYWMNTDEKRRRKYYRITAKGRGVLETKRQEWTQFSKSVNGVLEQAFELA